jgi:hypothetical protein
MTGTWVDDNELRQEVCPVHFKAHDDRPDSHVSPESVLILVFYDAPRLNEQRCAEIPHVIYITRVDPFVNSCPFVPPLILFYHAVLSIARNTGYELHITLGLPSVRSETYMFRSSDRSGVFAVKCCRVTIVKHLNVSVYK